MKNLNIAVADDNDAVVCMLSSIIENDEDFNLVGTARNGAQTLEMIRDKEPDVVLLDMIMPKMDGLGVMEQVSRDTSLKKHPAFIIISAVGHESMTESAFGLGADYYLMKPFDNHALVRRLHDLWQAVNGNAPKHPVHTGISGESRISGTPSAKHNGRPRDSYSVTGNGICILQSTGLQQIMSCFCMHILTGPHLYMFR